MILEGIVTTLDARGTLNIAPMGPRVDPAMQRFVLRPYRTSTTYANLKAAGEGVFHVTDDALLIARTAIGLPAGAATQPAAAVRGRILTDACRYYEFRVLELDDREERTTIAVGVVAAGRLRDVFGFNRAKHAVVEAAILATRVALIPRAEIEAEYRKLAVVVEKTGGEPEREAMRLLTDHVNAGGPAGAGEEGESRP